jgi:hypothetical protein
MKLKDQPNPVTHNKSFNQKVKDIDDQYLTAGMDKYKTYYNSIKQNIKINKSKAYKDLKPDPVFDWKEPDMRQ